MNNDSDSIILMRAIAAGEILIVSSSGSVSKLNGFSNEITPYKCNDRSLCVDKGSADLPKLIGLGNESGQGLGLGIDFGAELM